MRVVRQVSLVITLLVGMGPTLAADVPDYPDTRRTETVDVLHGREVADPYRWLEDDPRTSKQVAKWIESQNAVTLGFLQQIPEREGIRARLTELWDYERYSSPFKIGGRYYYFKNNGLQNQSVMYTLGSSLDGTPRTVLDPNTWSDNGTVALSGLSFSDDGRYLAYARSTAGSDWQEWFVHDLNAGKDLPDHLRWTKFTGTSWTKDGKGFFYGRFKEPEEGEEFQALNRNQKLYYHRAGTSQSDDVLVYERPDEPSWGFATSVSEDGRYLVISIWKGTDPRNRVLYRDLTEPYAAPVQIIGKFNNEYSFLGNDGHVFYFKTDQDAPNGRVIAMDIRSPERKNWKEILPESEAPLDSITITGNLFVATYLEDVINHVKMFRMDGTHVRDVEFPGIGTGGGFSGKRTEFETFYTFSSFNMPPSIYRYDMITGESSLWRQAKVDFDPDDYVVKQVFYESKDGTKVPMFVSHRKDLPLDGNRPTLLYGYGGFGISLKPFFSTSRLAWMEMGGVYAQPNLRGGGEYGENWHKAGKLDNKQNVFDDFIAAAEWLIENKYTRSERLAIQGGSNGGLLVGASMTQRPDLFGAALPAVGVMDMLRFHQWTAGRFWVDDYGSPDDPKMFETLLAYSPYHNIKKGTKYPATLVTTADTDDRVIPAHSFKFASALQHAQEGSEPVLIRVESAAGHGAGKPTQKQIEEVADLWAFLVESLEMRDAEH